MLRDRHQKQKIFDAGLNQTVADKFNMEFIYTDRLKIAYESTGDSTADPVFLLHGWPDSPLGWKDVAPQLHSSGYRTIMPYLRGSYPTEFISAGIPRFAGAAAMAMDVIDLADRLNISQFRVVGHDWGARTAYTLATLFPDRVHAIAALALAYQPKGVFHLPDFQQAKQFWYQFFQCTPGGAEAVRQDPVGFARNQWATWSPAGWFSEDDFQKASEHFTHPDWAEITLNAYRARYLAGEIHDDFYDDLQARLKLSETVSVPTLMVQGNDDQCDLPSASEHQEKYFTRGYRRLLIDGVGHFPHREAPNRVAEAIVQFFAESTTVKTN